VDKKSSVSIELFEQQAQAEQAMQSGISRLILLNIPSPIKYLQEKLPNKAKLGLYFNPFGTIADLLQDCIHAGCQYLVKQSGDFPREVKAFDVCKDHVRSELADCVLAGAIKVEQALRLAHDIRKKMKGSVALNVIQSHADIKEQLDKLVYKGFVTFSGIDQLDNINRYLNALLRRLEKLPVDPNQDRLKMLEANKVTEAYQKLLSTQRSDKPLTKEILDIQWMLQELRVSLFAQNLGTAYPISVKRILNHIKSI